MVVTKLRKYNPELRDTGGLLITYPKVVIYKYIRVKVTLVRSEK